MDDVHLYELNQNQIIPLTSLPVEASLFLWSPKTPQKGNEKGENQIKMSIKEITEANDGSKHIGDGIKRIAMEEGTGMMYQLNYGI